MISDVREQPPQAGGGEPLLLPQPIDQLIDDLRVVQQMRCNTWSLMLGDLYVMQHACKHAQCTHGEKVSRRAAAGVWPSGGVIASVQVCVGRVFSAKTTLH